MGGKGRTPRPTHIRALEGVKEYRLNRDEPIPGEGLVVPPVDLPADAMAIWNRLAPDMIQKKVLTCYDVDEFANGCRFQALLNEALTKAESSPMISPGSNKNPVLSPAIRAVVALEASLRAVWSRFGLTPGDRATLRVDHTTAKSGLERYLT
jgi:P27 family predicted phage terminase small subunit